MIKAILCFSIVFWQHYDFATGEHYPVNWTEASVYGMGIESHYYQDPAMKPLAPCPCDLNSNTCDVYCCCDQDCSPYDLTSFSCLEGLEGGEQTPQDLDYNCKYKGPYSPEFHSSLCFISSNNPYLGLFFPNEAVIRESQHYNDRVPSQRHSYEVNRFLSEDPSYQPYLPYYIANTTIEIAFQSESEIIRSSLTLPQPFLNGICVDSIPVKYLENFKHQCFLTLSEEVCESEPKLSFATYLQERDEVNSKIYENFPLVISDLVSLETINATVKYLCLKSTFKFIKVNGLSNTAMKFMTDNWDIIDEYFEDCDMHKVPSYNEKFQMCENVVLSVHYNIGWKGAKIMSVDAQIVIGDVPVSLEGVQRAYFEHLDSSVVVDKSIGNKRSNVMSHKKPFLGLVQSFETSFYYIGPVLTTNATFENDTLFNDTYEENDSDLEYDVNNVTERSGNPGYDFGKPLIAGYIKYSATDEENTTHSNFSHVNIDDETGLFIWRPDAASRCSDASAEEVIFGTDMFSACLFSVSKGYNCDEVREEILAMMSQLIQADVVSKMGSPDVHEENDYLPVILYTDDHEDRDRCYIPMALHHEIIYRDIIDIRSLSLSIYQVIGISTRLHYAEMLTDPQKSEISVLLSSSVAFLQSPKPSQLSVFWKVMEDKWCAGGTCWRELLYPWTHGADSGQEFDNEYFISLFGNSILLLLLGLPTFYFVFQKSLYLRF